MPSLSPSEHKFFHPRKLWYHGRNSLQDIIPIASGYYFVETVNGYYSVDTINGAFIDIVDTINILDIKWNTFAF